MSETLRDVGPKSAGDRVGVLMGSKSDWDTMQHAVSALEELGVACDVRALSAHRTPDAVVEFVRTAEERSVRVIIAAAGGAAHLAGVVAAHTTLPVLGVPMKGWALEGLDALLSTVQMPAGVPVATFAIGKAGAINAAIFAAQILGVSDATMRAAVDARRARDAAQVLDQPDPRVG